MSLSTRAPKIGLALALCAALTALFLAACQAPPLFPTPAPTATPVPSPTFTPLPPTPTPTPVPPTYLGAVSADALPPTSTIGAILFSSGGVGEGPGREQVLWRLSSQGLITLTDRLLPGRWDCNQTGSQICAFADQAGQVYTSTLISPAVPLLGSPSLPLNRLDLSPDGLRLAVMLTDDLDIIDLQQPAPVAYVAGITGTTDLYWSPDSQRLLYITRTETAANLYVVDLNDDAAPDQVATGDWIGLPAWSPDGKQIAFAQRGLDHPNGGSRRQDLFVSDVGGVEVVNRTEFFEPRARPEPDHAIGVRWLSWLPDASALAFTWTSWTASPDSVEADKVPAAADGGAPTQVLADAGVLAADGTRLLWSRDGNQVAAVISRPGTPPERVLWLGTGEADTWLPLTPPEQIVDDVCWLGAADALVYTTLAGDLYWVGAGGGMPIRLVSVAAPQVLGRLACPPG